MLRALAGQPCRPEGIYFDEKTPAFGMRVGKNRKTWIVLKEPNRTKLRLGHYPDLSLAEARKKALVAIGTSFDVRVKVPSLPKARQKYLDQGNWPTKSRAGLISFRSWGLPQGEGGEAQRHVPE